ncbi:hypothetical protein ACQWF9_27145, partial [Salmonella enterica subsp. enterica serovar Infantis]
IDDKLFCACIVMRNSSQQTADENCNFLSIYFGFLFICHDSIAIAFFFCGFLRFFESQSTFGVSLNSGVKYSN